MKNLLFLFTLVLGLISCKTNPPTEPINPVAEYGTINIISNVSSAKILFDGIDTGKLTPDTIKTTAGNHQIKLIKDDYDTLTISVVVEKNITKEVSTNLYAAGKVVLIEDFANVSCDPCVISNKILEQLTNNTFGRSKVVAVKFPTNFPSPNDLFFLANPQECNARMQYYNIMFAPTNIIDGTLRPIPSDSNDVKAKIISELATVPKFLISVANTIVGSTCTIDISLSVKDISSLDFSNLVLHTIVTETNIEFATPPGSNGETKFYDVMRKMLPNQSGESLSSITQTGTYNYQRQLTLNSNWIQSNINVVVFIQNSTTKEILQAGSTFN